MAHPKLHLPSEHVAAALGGTGHVTPHVPQLVGSVAVLAQMAVAAQYIVPVGHDDMHVDPAQRLPATQVFPHAPQLELVLSVASQPLAALPSQSAKPALQVATVQRPAAQPAVALGSTQGLPQLPHEVAVLDRLVSQPSVALALQSPKPGLHAAMVQAPAAHAAVALASAHALPHAPQWVALVLLLVSQPVMTLESQSAKPRLHVNPHVPAMHAGAALAKPGQTVPHIPQLLTSVAAAAHTLEAAQYEVPIGQTLAHTDPAQRKSAPQTVPHAPQLALVLVGVSQPLAATPSQSAKPGLHAATAQRPAAQLAVALARVQMVPHAPHAEAVVPRLVSQPLAAIPSQSPKPASHAATTQAPPMHAGAAWLSLHVVPQAPHAVIVVPRLVSQPLLATPSQSP